MRRVTLPAWFVFAVAAAVAAGCGRGAGTGPLGPSSTVSGSVPGADVPPLAVKPDAGRTFELPPNLVEACANGGGGSSGGACAGAARWVDQTQQYVERQCTETSSLDTKQKWATDLLYLSSLVQLLDLAGILPEVDIPLSEYCGGLFDDSITWIELNPSSATLKVGEAATLTPTIHCSNGTCTGPLFWSSDQPGIAEVDQTGLVTARSEGRAVIAVESQIEGLTASAEIEVVGEPMYIASGALSGFWEYRITRQGPQGPCVAIQYVTINYSVSPEGSTLTKTLTGADLLRLVADVRGTSHEVSESTSTCSTDVSRSEYDFPIRYLILASGSPQVAIPVTMFVQSSPSGYFPVGGDDVGTATATGDGVVFTLRRTKSVAVDEFGGSWVGDVGGQIRFSLVP